LNALAKIDDLRVAARTSSFSFKGKNADVNAIGRALNVKTVLEGSVRKFGDRIRITVQLINVADGYHIWSERYDQKMEDIFDVQDKITLAVVNALKVKLLGDEKEALLKRYTNNAEAYQLYLRGRFFFSKRTPEAFKKAIEYFEQAISLDPSYALAVAGLSDIQTFIGFYEIESPAQAAEKVRKSAYRSFELDPTLAETCTAVAIYKGMYEWKFDECQKEYDLAIQIDPKYTLAHHLNSTIFVLQGLFEQAIATERRAVELEPFAAIYSASLGWWFYIARRYDEAVAQTRNTIEFAPNHFFAYWVLGMICRMAGQYEEAVEVLQKAMALMGYSQHLRAELGHVYGVMGKRDETSRLLDELQEESKQHYVSPVNFAKLYLGLGDRERVLEWLEKACEERAVKLPWFLCDPVLDSFREEPRFKEVIRRVGVLKHTNLKEQSTGELNEAHTVIFPGGTNDVNQ
jgi:tetratricopeptide (TPR) repeat protein